MASVISGTPLTFNGEEARSGILDVAFQKPEVNRFHTVVEGILAKKQIAFIERLTKVTIKDTGCGTSAQSKSISMAEKFWEPQNVEMWIEQCATDLQSTFFVWGLARGYDKYDLEQATAGDDPQGFMTEFLMDIMSDAAYEDLLRLVWLGDTAITDITASPAGVLGSAADQKYYNIIDGFWKQAFTGVSGGTIPRYTITANAAVSKALQLSSLAAGISLTIFRSLIENADSRLRNLSDLVIVCTQTIYDNYLTYKEGVAVPRSFDNQDTAYSEAIYRGIPVIPFNLWDRYIQADMDNGTTYYLPHRAILTTKQNLQVGFDAAAYNQFQIWHSLDTKKTNMRGNYMVDAKLMREYLTSVAY